LEVFLAVIEWAHYKAGCVVRTRTLGKQESAPNGGKCQPIESDARFEEHDDLPPKGAANLRFLWKFDEPRTRRLLGHRVGCMFSDGCVFRRTEDFHYVIY